MRRKLDMQNGLGWAVADHDVADLLLKTPSSVKNVAKGEVAKEPYFASTLEPGPRRLLEITRESSWWSRHLARKLALFCWGTFFVATILSLAGLFVSLQIASATMSPGRGPTFATIARVVTSVLTLVLSLGTVKLALAYGDFEKKSAKIEESASRSIHASEASEIDAIKTAHEYTLARACAPMIPEWIWQWNRDELNALWSKLKCS